MQRYRAEQEFYRTLLLATPPTNVAERKSAFENYRSAMFPHVVRHAVNTETTARRLLDMAVMRGPIVIRRDADVE